MGWQWWFVPASLTLLGVASWVQGLVRFDGEAYLFGLGCFVVASAVAVGHFL